MTTMTALPAGTPVTYLGQAAVVVHGNEPDAWTAGQPATLVNIRLHRAPRGMSPQLDVPATALLPAPAGTDRDDVRAAAVARLAALRAELTAAGYTASSPAVLDNEAERLAREEHWD